MAYEPPAITASPTPSGEIPASAPPASASSATPAQASAVATAQRAGRPAAVQQPLERAGERGRGAERDDRADGDARVVDRGEERRLVGRDAGGAREHRRRAPRRGRRRAPHEQREQDEQRAAAGDPGRADGRRVDPVGAERLRGARGAEAEGGEEDLESGHREIVPQFHNTQRPGVRAAPDATALADCRAMDLGLAGTAALVTGASGGIGSAVARELAAEGARVALHYHRNREAAEALAAELGGVALQADLRDEAQADALVPAAVEALGRLDACVANAGVWPSEDVPGRPARRSSAGARRSTRTSPPRS